MAEACSITSDKRWNRKQRLSFRDKKQMDKWSKNEVIFKSIQTQRQTNKYTASRWWETK